MTRNPGGNAVGAAPWMSPGELAQASGLREDLLARFIPATETPNGPMYPAHQMALAVYVKELTDHNLPPAAVEEKIREFTSRPPAAAPYVAPRPRPAISRGWLAAMGGVAAAALVLGGVVGGIIGSNNNNHPVAVPTVTVEAAAPQINPTIPATPDPVCAEWGPLSNAYAAKQDKWAQTDAKVPASAWGPEQRALNMDMVPIIRSQAADMKRLADKAQDPFLARLMREQAMYEEKFASRLPNYEPGDQALWQAAIDYGAAVRATCLMMKTR